MLIVQTQVCCKKKISQPNLFGEKCALYFRVHYAVLRGHLPYYPQVPLAVLLEAGLSTSLDQNGFLHAVRSAAAKQDASRCCRALEYLNTHSELLTEQVQGLSTSGLSMDLQPSAEDSAAVQDAGTGFFGKLARNFMRRSRKSEAPGDEPAHVDPGCHDSENLWTESFSSQLRSLQWIPVLPCRPGRSAEEQVLPWLPGLEQGQLLAPGSVRPPGDMWLCSGSYGILQTASPEWSAHPSLVTALGWDLPLPPEKLAHQLSKISDLLHKCIKVGCAEDVSSPSTCTLEAASSAALSIYSRWLSASPGELDEVRKILEGVQWVWTGNGFLSPARCSFSGSCDATPYLVVLPASAGAYRDVLVSLGVLERFQAQHYAKLLTTIAAEIHSAESSPPQPLPDRLIRVAVGCCMEVASDPSFRPSGPIYVPDSTGLVSEVRLLYYDDAAWITTPENSGPGSSGHDICGDAGVTAGRCCVHPLISNDLAARLGCASKRNLMLASSAEGVGWAPGEVEAFGQSEEIVSRIRSILDAYPDGNLLLFPSWSAMCSLC